MRAAAQQRQILLGATAIAGLVVLWTALTDWFHLLPPYKAPSAAASARAFISALRDGYAGSSLISHAIASIETIVGGLVLGVGTGLVLAYLMGRHRLGRAALNPLFQLLRPIAPVAWIPIGIMWFGLGQGEKVFIVAIATCQPIVINSLIGIDSTDHELVEMARSCGASEGRIFSRVRIPSALPMIMTGLRLSLQFSWMVLVTAEMIGATRGLGYMLSNAANGLFLPMAVVAMLCIAILGIAMTACVRFAERVLIPWDATLEHQAAGSQSRASRLRDQWPGALLLAVLILAWHLATSGTTGKTIPTPTAVLDQLKTAWFQHDATSTLAQDLVSTTERFVIAFVIAAAAGVLIALLIAASDTVSGFATPIIELYRFIPPIAWIPLAIAWFGATPRASEFIVGTGVFSACLINSLKGARLIDPQLREMCRNLGCKRWRLMREVLFPGSLRATVGGLRIAAAVGWATVIGAELIVGTRGLGNVLLVSEQFGEVNMVVAIMVLIGLCGWLIDVGMLWCERKSARK